MSKNFRLILISILVIVYSCNSFVSKEKTVLHTYYSKEFRLKWKTDSLGQLGFREKYLGLNCIACINGVNLTGYSKDEIISIFGKPTNVGYGKEDGLLMIFYLAKKGFKIKTETFIIDFDKKNKVTDITLETGL
jgi:hypothetical protein